MKPACKQPQFVCLWTNIGSLALIQFELCLVHVDYLADGKLTTNHVEELLDVIAEALQGGKTIFLSN